MVASSAKAMLVRYAREAPANMADMPISAAIGRPMCADGKTSTSTEPAIAPQAPPMVNKGASVPPEVPLPSAIAQETNLNSERHNRIVNWEFYTTEVNIW